MKRVLSLDVLLLLIVFAITYITAPFIFFQQDEWRSFGLMIAQGPSSAIGNFGSSSFHLVPVNLSLAYSIFKFFDLSHVAYNLAGLTFHFTNGVLVYAVALKVLKKRWIAVLTGILFITSSVSAQLVMWPAVSISTLSLTFALISWFILVRKESSLKFIDGFLAALFMVLSFLTVEYSLGFLLFVPLAYLLLKPKVSLKEKIGFLLPVAILNLAYLLIRAASLLVRNSPESVKVVEAAPLSIFERIFSMPVRYLGQSLIPEDIFLLVSHNLTKNIVKAETIIFSGLATATGIFIFAVIIFLCFVSWRNQKFSKQSVVLMILLFLLTSTAPFILLPGGAGGFSIFPPRYLYFGIAGIALLMGLIVEAVFLHKNRLLKILLFIPVFLMIITGIMGNWSQEEKLVKAGKIREDVLKTIQTAYPILPSKTVFYITSDTQYYYQPEEILPFQSGLGQTLLVWYHREDFGKDFYEDDFLWDISSQDYREAGNRGFGYYRDYAFLNTTVKKYKIPIESVIAFSWQGKEQKLFDITAETRQKLKEENSK